MLETLHIQGNLFVVSNYPPSIYQEIRKRENPRQNYDAEITAKCFVAGEMDDGIVRYHALRRNYGDQLNNENDQRPINHKDGPNMQPHFQGTHCCF